VKVNGSLTLAGIGGFVGYGAYYGVLTTAAATGTTTVMAPALMVAGAMIAVGVNQINHSNAMINNFNKAMIDMKLDF